MTKHTKMTTADNDSASLETRTVSAFMEHDATDDVGAVAIRMEVAAIVRCSPDVRSDRVHVELSDDVVLNLSRTHAEELVSKLGACLRGTDWLD